MKSETWFAFRDVLLVLDTSGPKPQQVCWLCMLTAAETVHEGSHCHGCILANSVFEVNHACDSQHAFAKSMTSDVQKQNHVAYTGRARQELNNESNQMPDLKMLHPSVSTIGQPSWFSASLTRLACQGYTVSLHMPTCIDECAEQCLMHTHACQTLCILMLAKIVCAR